MEVKIIIQRRYSEEQKEKLEPILRELFQLVYEYGGYVSGETLVDVEDPLEHVILSTWKSLDQWQQYHEAERVKALCGIIDAIITHKTIHRVYSVEKQLFRPVLEGKKS